MGKQGRLGGAVSWASSFVSGHHLTVHEFEPSSASGSGLMAQSLEPASDSVSPSLSLSAPSLLTLCLSLKKTPKNKQKKPNSGILFPPQGAAVFTNPVLSGSDAVLRQTQRPRMGVSMVKGIK